MDAPTKQEEPEPVVKQDDPDAAAEGSPAAVDARVEADAKQQEPEGDAVKDEDGGASVSDEVVKERLLLLLAESDLSTTTEKMLRKQLEKQLGVKLGDKKALIREEVLAYLDTQRGGQGGAEGEGKEGEQEEEDEEYEDEGEEAYTKRKRSGGALGSLLSEPMQAFLGVKRMARPQVVKAMWAYIRANNLQDPNDKRNILVDEKLATLFTPPINMFNMNKQLSKHVFTKDVAGGSDESDEGEGSCSDEDGQPRKRPAKKAKKAGGGGGTGGGFTKPMRLSEELAAATGESEMSRGAVTKWFWAYINERDLKDPSDRSFVLSDETLKNLTGQKRFKAFTFQKHFSKHFLKD